MIKRNLLVMGLAIMLSACGFQLRGTGTNEMALKELDVSARNAYGPTVQQLNQVLKSAGVHVHKSAPYKLVLTDEQTTSRAASYAGSGRSVEYELTTTLYYSILGQNKAQLLADKIEVQKTYLQDGNNLAGSDQEAAMVTEEMRRDLVQGMINRLQLLSLSQLETLQQQADERARAEAQALEAARRAQAEQPQQSPIEIPTK